MLRHNWYCGVCTENSAKILNSRMIVLRSLGSKWANLGWRGLVQVWPCGWAHEVVSAQPLQLFVPSRCQGNYLSLVLCTLHIYIQNENAHFIIARFRYQIWWNAIMRLLCWETFPWLRCSSVWSSEVMYGAIFTFIGEQTTVSSSPSMCGNM